IQLQMTAGTRKHGLPNLGDPLLLCKEKRTWGFTGKMLSIFSRRLNFQPQTHFTNGTLSSTPRPSISNFSLLRFLETLK
ncbi:MAG: hypothetical protein VX278_18940, partial [Myxococcota bacterium]|nr:hypothetical protein [Myxococcota bacterium]